MDNIIDVTELPIWTPWVMLKVQSDDNTPDGRAFRVGSGMTKHQAWDIAREEMEKRPDALAMAVRRDGALLTELDAKRSKEVNNHD